MEYLNHIIINSGHYKKSFPIDVNNKYFFALKRVYKESFNIDGVTLLDKYIVKSTKVDGHGVVTTIFNLYNIPIMTSAFVSEEGSKIWEVLHSSSNLPVATDSTNPPEVPYIADRLEIGFVLKVDRVEWTADFSRCLAWIHFSPNSIL
ncbi:hypothetical protein ACIQZG_11680 [Lysinibacillus sp. NPDC096418]|uniref:hypothetical protein n=1 Tax=Lysinibacillus sp. NPDC096418 TaxID=3364138 RepID=UPI0037FA22C4